MKRKMQSYEGIALVAPVTIPYEKKTEHSAEWFIGRVLAELLQESGLEKSDVDGLSVASFSSLPDTTISMTTYLGMSPRWIDFLPTGGASGVMSLRRAARTVQAGDAEVVACIAGDIMSPAMFNQLINNFSKFSKDTVYPYGAAGPNANFSMITQHYMEKFSVSREDFGLICISQRENALASSRSLFNKPLSMDDYINARPIAEPIHLYDCVMPCSGGEGFLVMSIERAESLNLPYAVIRSSGESHNAFSEDDVHYRGGWALYRDALYESAGMGPEDMGFLQTYDDYPVIVMLQLEDLGFCEKGEAAKFVRNNQLTWDGDGLPHNTCGGQLSSGQAGAAGGFMGVVEGLKQLTKNDLPNQIPGVKAGVVSGYGMVIYDHCLSTAAAILARPDA